MRLTAFMIVFMLSSPLLAEEKFDGINKDVTVMTQILTGVFKADNECRHCRIRAHYLAEQGLVFFVSMPRGFEFRFGSGGLSDLEMPELGALEHIPEIVDEALASVEYELSELDSYIYIDGNDQSRHITIQRGVDRELLDALREVRRDRREVEREIREKEIRLIREDDDKTREQVRKEIEALNENLAEIGSREEKFESRVNTARQQAEEKRKKALAEARTARQERQRTVEDLVLQTFCDYGSTLKNLPEDEHVSLVFENSREGDSVYVLEQSDINQCSKGADELKASAIAYRFQPE